MKICKLTVLLFLLPVFAFTQQLSGVWIGKLTNDSLTTRKDQSFELALTEYKGKVYGYSYTTFIVEDTLYYIVKRVKGTIENDYCEVEDDEIVSNNFFRRLDKGVKVTQKFRLNKIDSTWYIDGNWKTNSTKKFYALTGSIALKQEKDFDKSRLLQHLGDLQLDNTLSFYKPEKKVYLPMPQKTPVKKQELDIAKTNPSQKKPSQADTKSAINSFEIKAPVLAKVDKPVAKDEPVTKTNSSSSDIITFETEIKKPDTTAAIITKNNAQKKNPDAGIKFNNPVPDVKNENPAVVDIQNKMYATNIKKPDTSTVVTLENNPQKKNPDAGIKLNTPVPDVKNENPAVVDIQNKMYATNIKKPDPVAVNTISAEKKVSMPDSITGSDLTVNAVTERKKHIIQTVDYKSDSLVLSLYDNGEIDGDTVSVFVNGEMIIERQGLKATALKRTIFLKPGESEEVEILLFAENLGSLPPNTGLLIIKDGDDRYEIRFSADYDLSPAIVLRRKKNPSP